MIQAVVFDFDGVIADSEPLHFRAFRTVLAEEAVTLTEDDYYQRYLGYDDAGVFRAVGAARGMLWTPEVVAGLVERKAARLDALERDGSVLFPGADAAIRRLARSCPLAIASGALGPEIRRVLARERLEPCFAVIVSASDGVASKPSPAPYRLAVQRLSAVVGHRLPPDDCVAVEDSSWGLESAKAAGLVAVGVTHTYPREALALADAVISSLEQLTWERLGSLAQPSRSSFGFTE